MMKRILTLAMIVALPMLAMAQTVKLGYINSQEVLMLMPELSDVEKQMADFNAQNTKYLQDMQKEIQDKVAKYENEAETMSEAIRKVQEQELNSLYERYQTTQQTFYQETQTKQQKLLQPLQEKLQGAIDAAGKKLNLTFVFDVAAGSVVYKSEQAVDITSEVKKTLGIF